MRGASTMEQRPTMVRPMFSYRGRCKESVQQREERLRKDRERKRAQRATEDPEQRAKRLQKNKEHTALKRNSESAQERAIRLERLRIAAEYRRENETELERSRRLETMRDYATSKRENETDLERSERLETMRDYATSKRENETDLERSERLETMRMNDLTRSECETDEDYAFRTGKMKRKAKTRRQRNRSLSELESHECREKEPGEDSTLKVSDLSTADLQLLLDTLTGGMGKVQNSPTKKPAPNSAPGIATSLPTPSLVTTHAVPTTPISVSSKPPPVVSTPVSVGTTGRSKSAPSPSKVPSTLAGIISSLFGPGMGGLSPQAVLEALSELPPAKVTELLTTLTVNQDILSNLAGGSMATREGIISSLATNPPKLPDSLVPEKEIRIKTTELPSELPCPRCQDKFITKQALASHLQACAAPTDKPTDQSQTPSKPGTKPDLKLIHRQLFIAAQNIDVSLLNISQVETLIQVLASEDGIKSVSQARVVDLLDTIEKWVKKKEAMEKEMRKKAKMSQSPAVSPIPTQNSPKPARNSPLPVSARNSPLPKETPPITSPRVTKNSSPVKPASLTDCLPPQITAAILPAIKDEQTDLGLLTKICTGMGGCNVTLPESLSTHLSLAVTKSIQILRHPDSTNKSTLSELKAIIISILGDKSSSDNSIKQGIMNVLKRNYRTRDLQGTTTVNLDTFVQYLVKEVLPGLGELSPNLLTLPFLLDLVLKNNKFVEHASTSTSSSKTLSSVADTAVSTSTIPITSTIASSS